MKLIGEINNFLNALGKVEGNKTILDAIITVSSDFEVSFFMGDGDEDYMYYNFFKNGVDFVFRKFRGNYYLESIFLYIQEDVDYHGYRFFDKLIGGFDSTFTKSDVISMLGRPIDSSEHWVKYEVDRKFIHFEFDKTIKQISLFV